METKARLGLFVGGLVLVGMVAYVMMPRSTGHKADDAAAAGTSPEGADYAAAPSTQPTTQPIAITDPFAAPAPAPGSVSATPDLAAPGAQPGVASTAEQPAAGQPAPADAADSNDVWARALDTGSTQTRTTGGLAAHSSLMSHATSLVQTPALPEPAAQSSASSTAKTYKVESGDSLTRISMKVFGNTKYTNKILAANPGLNARRLRVGQELKLPEIAGSQTPAAAHSTAASHAEAAAPRLASAAGQKTYKVQAGDTLTRISTKLYGKSSMWKQLYAANRSKIGSDPTHIRVGMVLQVPGNVQ